MNQNQPIVPDEIIPPNDVIDRRHKEIPIESIIEYMSKGLNLGEVAKLCNCSKQNIQQRLKAVAFDKTDLENFKKRRVDVFAFIQSKLLNSIDLEELKKMPVYQRVVSASILYDKERLESGKSTSNINVVEVQGTIEDLQKQAAALRKTL
jgi:predicted DNA-binding protein YlxM (UPF0122 family)